MGERRARFEAREVFFAAAAGVVELGKARRTLPIDELADLVAGCQHEGDVLLVPHRP